MKGLHGDANTQNIASYTLHKKCGYKEKICMLFGALNSEIFTITYIQPQKALNESILNPTQISSTVTIKKFQD